MATTETTASARRPWMSARCAVWAARGSACRATWAPAGGMESIPMRGLRYVVKNCANSTTSCAFFSVRPARRQHGKDRLPEDLQVEGERPVLDVVEVESDAVLPRQVGPAADLPEARDPWLDQQPPVDVVRVVGDFARQRRPRPDERHVAADDVEQLRQLVERVAPQELADASDARVVLHLEQQTVGLVEPGEGGEPL